MFYRALLQEQLKNQLEIATDPFIVATFHEANVHVQSTQNVYMAEGTEDEYQESKKVKKKKRKKKTHRGNLLIAVSL